MQNLKTLNTHSALFISLVIVAFFWHFFYNQFYGQSFKEYINTDSQSTIGERNQQIEQSSKFLEAYQLKKDINKNIIDKKTIKSLKQQAKEIALNHLYKFGIKCNDNYYFIEETVIGFPAKIFSLTKVKEGVARVFNYEEYSFKRAKNKSKQNDAIKINIYNKTPVYYTPAYIASIQPDTWKISHEKEATILASWRFEIDSETKKLINMPPTPSSPIHEINEFLAILKFYKYPESSKNKYRCSDIPSK